jgi:hypothetical protein
LSEPDPQGVDVIPGSEEDHRDIEAVASDATADLEPVDLRHVDIEDDQIGCLALDAAEGVEPVALGRDVVAGEAEGAGHEVRQ